MNIPERPFDRIDIDLLSKFSDRIIRFYEIVKSELEYSKLGSSQIKVLAFLVDHEGSSQQDVADEFGISRSTVSEVLTQLESKQFIVRQPSEGDRRATSIRLTDLGRAVGSKVRIAYERYCSACFRDLSGGEAQLFMEFMERFIRQSYLCESHIKNEVPVESQESILSHIHFSLTSRICGITMIR